MKIKYILILLVLSFVLPFRLSSQDKTIQPFFEYPVVPDKLTNTNLRANYMVEHFWEKCKLEKETITNINAFHESFTDYLSFFILAEKPAVEKSIKKFVERVAKNADNLNLSIGMINAEVLNMKSQYCSDEVYDIFVTNLVANKKVPKEVKEVLQRNNSILKNSRLDALVADFPLMQSPAGAASLYDLTSEYTLIFINEESNVDCSIYRARLNANMSANNLIKAGTLRVVSVWMGDKAAMGEKLETEPITWEVAYLPEIGKVLDRRMRPTVYLLDKEKKIAAKFLTADDLMNILAGIEMSQENK